MDKKKLDLIKNFSKLWKFKEDDKDKDAIPKEEWVGYFDPPNVVMIIPKLYSIKKLIEDNFEAEPTTKIPNMNYYIKISEYNKDKLMVAARLGDTESALTENSVRVSKDYIKIILMLCTNTKSEKLIMKFRKDYPLWLETDEMICIIAPRIED